MTRAARDSACPRGRFRRPGPLIPPSPLQAKRRRSRGEQRQQSPRMANLKCSASARVPCGLPDALSAWRSWPPWRSWRPQGSPTGSRRESVELRHRVRRAMGREDSAPRGALRDSDRPLSFRGRNQKPSFSLRSWAPGSGSPWTLTTGREAPRSALIAVQCFWLSGTCVSS
jgi:hypothetical protein